MKPSQHSPLKPPSSEEAILDSSAQSLSTPTLKPLQIGAPLPTTAAMGQLFFNTQESKLYVYTATGQTGWAPAHTAKETKFNILDFGASTSSSAENTAALQGALNAARDAGGGCVYIPAGRFRKSCAPNSRLIIYSNTTICGDGEASVLFFDDDATIARNNNDLLRFDDVSNIEFRDFKIEATALSVLSETNQKQGLTGRGCDGLRLMNVTFEGMRFMATAFSYVKNAVVSGCRLKNCIRDGIRLTNSQNVIVTGNNLQNVADDCIALHSLDESAVPSSGFIVTNNTIEGCQGIKILGAKICTISNNVFRRSLRAPIYVSCPGSGTEGNTAQFAINITGNVIMDTFGNRGINTVIAVKMAVGRKANALSQMPGVSIAPNQYNYLNNIDAGTVNPGQYGVVISNNMVGTSLPTGVLYSSFGVGQLFDRTNPGLLADPVLTASSFACHLISLVGPSTATLINGNMLSGCGVGYAGILLGVTGTSNRLDNSTFMISNNVFFDIPGTGILPTTEGSGVGSQQIIICNNVFDLDPFFRAPPHSPDNTWTTGSDWSAVRGTAYVNSMYLGGNVFKNCATTGLTDAGNEVLYPNIIYSDFVGSGDNPLNKGVRSLPRAGANVIIPIDGDPASITFGQAQSKPVLYSAAMPTSGRYVWGHFVRNTSPVLSGSPGSKYIVHGWVRGTTGGNHILNSDWFEMRSSTGA